MQRLEQLEFTPDEAYGQHYSALFQLREVFELLLVPLSYLDEQDALGLCIVNCNLKKFIEQEANIPCRVYLMSRGQSRLRRLAKGVVPELFQGRSTAGPGSYPGDRAFIDTDTNTPTVQIHMLRVQDGDRALDNVPAVAVRLPRQEYLIHDE